MTLELQRHEQVADRLRDGLLLGLRELDRRRRRVSPAVLGERARESTLVRGLAALGMAGVAGGVFAYALWRRRRNRPTARLTRHMRARRDALVRAWRRPDLLTTPAEPRLASQLGRKVALIAVTSLATAAAKQATYRLTPHH